MTAIASVGTVPADLLSAELSAQPGTVAFLRELARVRDVPISVPLAFNALAYAYDLQAGQYDPTLLSATRLPAVAADTTIDALPVGALAQLATGGAPQPFEVIFRHAEHPALHEDGSSPAWLSGAPAGVTGPPTSAGANQHPVPTGEVVLIERLVIDATALGSGAPARLRRLTGRAITAEGHLVVYAAYLDAEQADLDDTRLYASHLLSRRAEDLQRCLAGLGPVGTPAELANTLHATFDVLAALLDAAGLLRWHDKYVHPDTYARWTHGDTDVRTVEPTDVDRFCLTAARMSLPRTRRGVTWPGKPSYLAIGPTLRASVTDPDAPDLPAAGLRGPQYATALTCAQLYLAQTLSDRHDGIVDVHGAEVHVRLDDAWQGGGIWRAHVLARNELLDPIDMPLALGWLTTLQPDVPVHPIWHSSSPDTDPTDPAALTPAPTSPAPAPEPAAEPRTEPTAEPEVAVEPDPPAEPEPDAQPAPKPEDEGTAAVDRWVDDTTLGWRFVLGPRHASRGSLPLTPKVAAAMHAVLPPGTGLHLDLSHPGNDLPAEQRRQRTVFDGRALTGLHWPDSLFLGIRLTASWSTDGYQVALSTTALDEPVDVDGIPLDYDFDGEIVLRYLLAVDLDADADVLAPASLRALIRKQGRLAGSGSGALFVPLRELATAVRAHAVAAGSPAPTTEQLCQALEVAAGANTGAVRLGWGVLLTRDDGDGRWLAPRWPCPCDPDWHREPAGAPLSAGDPAVVLSLHPTAADRPSRRPASSSGLPGTTEEFLRRGHLRRLPRGQSPRQRELAIAYARVMGWDPRTLDPRTTFVSESHVRR